MFKTPTLTPKTSFLFRFIFKDPFCPVLYQISKNNARPVDNQAIFEHLIACSLFRCCAVKFRSIRHRLLAGETYNSVLVMRRSIDSIKFKRFAC